MTDTVTKHWLSDDDISTFILLCLDSGVSSRDIDRPDGPVNTLRQTQHMPYAHVAKGFILASRGMITKEVNSSRYLQDFYNRLLDQVDPLPT